MIGCRDAIHGMAHVLERHYQIPAHNGATHGHLSESENPQPVEALDEIHRSRVSAVRLQGFARLLISRCRMKSARKNLFGAASSWHSGVQPIEVEFRHFARPPSSCSRSKKLASRVFTALTARPAT